jgi:cold shock CspA family protein
VLWSLACWRGGHGECDALTWCGCLCHATHDRTRPNYATKEKETVMTGRIKRINERGFAFATAGDVDYFFHRSAVLGSFEELQVGEEVRFKVIEDSPKGPRADQVERVGAADSPTDSPPAEVA